MRLIDADALLKDLRSECPESDVCFSHESCIDCIVKRQPTIEPEARHGRMIEGRHPNENKCSECGQEFREEIFFIYPYDQNGISKTPKRCPECGCYWDGGADNG